MGEPHLLTITGSYKKEYIPSGSSQPDNDLKDNGISFPITKQRDKDFFRYIEY